MHHGFGCLVLSETRCLADAPMSMKMHPSKHRTGPVKIGVLYSNSGVTSAAERSQLQATILAVEEINHAGGVMGRPVELICLDPKCETAAYASLAQELISVHDVRIIVGCYMSSTRKAVIPVIERNNALLFYSTHYEGFEYSPNVIYTGAAPNQSVLPLAGFMLAHHGSRVSMIGSDYVCPWESSRVMSDVVTGRGGFNIGETYLALDAGWEQYLHAVKMIKHQAPDFIFSTVVGDGIPLLHRAFAEVGMDPYKTPIASQTTSEAEIALMGNDLAEGHITAATYFQSIDSDNNHRAIARYRARFGDTETTNMCWESAYFQMHILAEGIRRAQSDDPNVLRSILPGIAFDAPQGLVRIDEQNNHTYLRPRIARVDPCGRFEIIASAPGLVKADPYVVSQAAPEWTDQSPSELAASGAQR